MSAHGWGFYFLPGVTSDDVSRAILRDSNYPDGTVVYGMRRRTCAGCSSPLTRSPLMPLPADPAPFGVSIFQWWTQSIVPSLIRCYRNTV